MQQIIFLLMLLGQQDVYKSFPLGDTGVWSMVEGGREDDTCWLELGRGRACRWCPQREGGREGWEIERGWGGED